MTQIIQTTKHTKIIKYGILICVIFIYLFILIRTAWLSDDAYITFRTVDNFINGYGLTWNTIERVQVYTNPLWMFLLSGIYFFTHEIFFSSLIFSIFVSLLVVSLFAFKITDQMSSGLLGMVVLIFSRAFMDYSTSGLENPLTHLILVMFFWVYLQRISDQKTLLWLALLAACASVNRLDILLICLPVLILEAFQNIFFLNQKSVSNENGSVFLQSLSIRISHFFRTFIILAAGFLPLILWLTFSLFYYGFPLPNTAYAKLITPIQPYDLVTQGFQYIIHSFSSDPITPTTIFFALLISFKKNNRQVLPVGIGIILYLTYILRIGGDFMEGRMLAAPFICAVILLAQWLNQYSSRPINRDIHTIRIVWDRLYPACTIKTILPTVLGLIGIILLGFCTPYPTVLNTMDYRSGDHLNDFISSDGIADERGYYYQFTGLLRAHSGQPLPVYDHPWALIGRKLRQSNTRVAVLDSIGFTGYYAGPTVHIVDTYGLADGLISRIPPKSSLNWRIGHFKHDIPCGYLLTLSSGINQIKDSDLAAYYAKLSLITQGKLLDLNRMVSIWEMNRGKYTPWLTSYTNRPGCSTEVNP